MCIGGIQEYKQMLNTTFGRMIDNSQGQLYMQEGMTL